MKVTITLCHALMYIIKTGAGKKLLYPQYVSAELVNKKTVIYN